MRRIDQGADRASSWAEGALRELVSAVGRAPEIETWALQVLTDERNAAGRDDLERWRVALEEGRRPDPRADRLVAAIGILQECCGTTVSTAAATPWEARKGERT
jgi:hypothetical protein